MNSSADFQSKTVENTSPLIKSFWSGKYLQALTLELSNNSSWVPGLAVDGYHNNDDDAVRSTLENISCLSSSVHTLITKCIPPTPPIREITNPLVIENTLTLNWTVIEDFLKIGPDLRTVSYQLGMVAKYAFTSLTTFDKSRVMFLLPGMYEWTQSPLIFRECLESLISDDPSPLLNTHTCLLLCTAAVERSLGDVYVQVAKTRQCPRLLKDLLATTELECILGKLPMVCLRCLIGPPSGFNLRNIIWHGFAADGEIPKELVLLLLLVIASFSPLLDPHIPLTHRPYLTFPQELTMKGVFPDFMSSDIDGVHKLFCCSFFVLPSMLSLWLSALDFYKHEKYGHFISLILPCLEHGLRRVFACCNMCPERVLTAESAILYTTFDEILSPVLQDGIQANQLPAEIGTPRMELLMDLLVHPEGPRLRDRVSHGEVDLFSLSKTLADFTLGVAIAFTSLYTIDYCQTTYPAVHISAQAANEYCSLFHPCSILKREILHLLTEMSQWKIISEYYGEQNEGGLNVSVTFFSDYHLIVDQLLLQFSSDTGPAQHKMILCPPVSDPTAFDGFNTRPMERLVEGAWSAPIKTLFMSRIDLEVTGILRRCIKHLIPAVKNIRVTAGERYDSYLQKGLRSRQRANFDRLLSDIGLYWSSVLLVCVLACIAISNYPTPTSVSEKLIRFYKKVLQFAENFSSQTSPQKNCWEEGERHCRTLIQLCHKPPTITQDK